MAETKRGGAFTRLAQERDGWKQRAEQAEADLATLLAGIAALEQAATSLLEIGKRDMSNPKYDGYFDSLRAALAALRDGRG